MEELVPLVRQIIENNKEQEENKSLSGLLFYYYSLFHTFKEEKHAKTIKFLSEKIFHPDNFREILHGTDCLFLLEDLQKYKFLSPNVLSYKNTIDDLLYEEALHLLESSDLRNLYKYCKTLYYFYDAGLASGQNTYKEKLITQLYQICEDESENFWDGNRFTMGTSKAFSLGFYEGFSGILVMLMNCNSEDTQDSYLKKIVKDGILYILSYKATVDFTENKFAVFPNIIDIANPPPVFTNQLNWHSSDLNIALLLYRAAIFFQEEKLSGMADLIGLNTLLRKDYKATGINTSCIFDGSAGVAQSYKILFELSQREAYRAGYEYWIKQTITCLKSELAENSPITKNNTLLHGLPGPALTLLSYLNNEKEEAKWSKSLLL